MEERMQPVCRSWRAAFLFWREGNQSVHAAALDTAGVRDRRIPIAGVRHDGFSREALVDSYKAVREFLRKYGILAKE
jgi:hypothetical protein